MRALLLLLVLSGCGPETAEPRVSWTAPEAPAGTGEGERTDFRRAFAERRVRLADGEVALTTRRVGELVVDDEALCAGTVDDPAALPIELAAGRYPVDVAQAGETVAAARVVLGSGTSERWEYLGSAHADGHLVLCGAGASTALAGPPGRDIAVRCQAGLDPAFVHEAVDGPDVFVCVSGYGEGAYDLFVGIDGEGEVVEIVVDFGVLVMPVEARHDLGDLLSLGAQALDVPGLTDRGVKVARVETEDVVLALDFASVIADPTIGGYELHWFDSLGEPMYARSQGFGSKVGFAPPRGARPVRAELRWVARLEPV